MSALSIQVPFPVFQDRDGQPLDDGYIWIGQPNLNPQTSPVVAYYDDALTIVATQPLRTINGYVSRAGTPAQVYVDAVNFSILVQDSKGSMVYNFPEGTGISPNASGVAFTGFKGQVGFVSDIADDDGADWIGFKQAGTGAVARSAQDKMRDSVSVKDFGAVGDGVADDTAAIQAAINYAKATSGIKCIEFPTGNYAVTSSIAIKGDFGFGFHIKGNKSKITSSHNGVVFDCDSSIPSPAPAFRLNLNISDLTIVGPGKANAASVGVKLYGANYSLNNVYITNFYLAVQGAGCLISEFVQCNFFNCAVGTRFTLSAGFSPNDVHFYKCNWIEDDQAISFANFDYGAITFIGCEIEGNNPSGNATDGVQVCAFADAGEVTFIGCHFESNPGQYNIYYDSPSGRHLNIIGCKIIPGDASGQCIYMGYGELYVNGSHVAQTVGQNIYLNANNGGAVVIGDTSGTINGTTNKLVRILQGRVTAGGATGAVAGISSKSASGVAADFEGQMRFVDSSNTRLGYLTSSSLVLDASSQYSFNTGRGSLYLTRTTTQLEPGDDNTWGLGSAGLRWSTVYAGTGTINTSDKRLKQQIRTLSDAEQATAIRCKSLLRAFKFNDAVAEKEDAARIHFGVIAQDVKAAFEAEGLVAEQYAILCFDEWADQFEKVRDENGNHTGEKKLIVPAGNRYGIRYDQLLAFIISAL